MAFVNISDYTTVYHGTSSLYFDYIKQDGLTGMYPDGLYQKLLMYYRLIPREKRVGFSKNFINEFIKRQENIRKTKEIDISLTNDYTQASEYANTMRINGEGPGYIIQMIRDNYEILKGILIDERSIKALDMFLTTFVGHTGIILLFKKSELLELVPEEDGGFVETQFDRPLERGGRILFKYAIPPRMIYLAILQQDRDRIKIVRIDTEEARKYIYNKIKAETKCDGLVCDSGHKGGLRVKHKSIKKQKQKRKTKTKQNKIH